MRFLGWLLALSQAACYDPVLEPMDERSEGGERGPAAGDMFFGGDGCPDGYEPSAASSCYRIADGTATWIAAEADCEDDVSTSPRAHLLVLDTTDEDLAVDELMADDYWLGLRHDGASWVWISTGSLPFSNWGQDEPSGEGPCAETKKETGKWDDEGCDDEGRAYVCEWDGP